jgi:lipoprotein-anchoring transpeptidase ErfK/SrfK
MRRGPVSAVAMATLALAGCGSESVERPPGAAPRSAAGAADPHPGDEAARPIGRVAMRNRPGGRVVARIGRRTGFGSARWMPIAARRKGWVGVIAPERPNGRLGWLPDDAVRVRGVAVRVRVDLSARRLRVTRDGRTLLRMRVGVGARGTATPTGRFAVTDGLHTRPGTPYGCCILALSGHQPNIAQGWTGGDRIAIHGTSEPASVGAAVSHGCLRAHDRDMRRLMRLARLGSLVEIRS